MKELTLILEHIATVRRERKYTQADIAHRLSINRSTYVRKEKGIIPMTLKEFLSIMIFLKINPEEFGKLIFKKRKPLN